MSDYTHEKVIRLPFPKELLKANNTGCAYDCEQYLEEKLGDLWNSSYNSSFRIESTSTEQYIDWCYYVTYGEMSGEWGNVRLLTQLELEVIKPYFDRIGIGYNTDDLRHVDYCYYNSCEPDDCYDIVDDDSSDLLIGKKNMKLIKNK